MKPFVFQYKCTIIFSFRPLQILFDTRVMWISLISASFWLREEGLLDHVGIEVGAS